jgi:hypothetical protein
MNTGVDEINSTNSHDDLMNSDGDLVVSKDKSEPEDITPSLQGPERPDLTKNVRKHGVASFESSGKPARGEVAPSAVYGDNDGEQAESELISKDMKVKSSSREKRESSSSLLDSIDLEAIKKSGNEVLSHMVEGIRSSCEPMDDTSGDPLSNAMILGTSPGLAATNLETIREGEVLDIPEESTIPLSSSPPATVSPAVGGASFFLSDNIVSSFLIIDIYVKC